ncbi:hypothetical protein FRC01_008835 [Tulasnella sp. 417]|nr:hypothetical protein FRC01_008835 [Tulasnella sp. 417]
MTTSPTGLPDDQRIKDYLQLELEFANEFAAKIVQAKPDWQSYQKFWSPVRRFLGVFFAVITEWKKIVSPSPREEGLEEDPEAAIDDPTDSVYQENWTPTSLYRWAYLTLKCRPIDLEDDELRDRLAVRMFRTQQYDAELLGSGCQNAYFCPEDLLSRSSSPAPEDRQKANPGLIHQLPPEILSDVFVRAHDGVLYFPIIVSHVDSRFRTIAESTALLWTKIDVNLPLPLVGLYLKRSNTARLDIRIDLGSGGRQQNAALRLGAFLAVVAEHRERVASLRMSAFNPRAVDDMVKAMMVGSGSTYPQLRRLDTGCPIWVSGTWPRLPLEPLDCLVVPPPRLQELCLRGSRSRNWVSAFPDPMPGLKSLCFANNTKLFVSDLLVVLSNLPNLETLVFQDCTIQQDPLAAPSAVTLPNLTTLQYVTVSEASMTLLYPALLTPKLTSLKLWWNSGFRNWSDHLQPLAAMLLANPQLLSLDLCNCMLQPGGWRDAFATAGSLKYLRLRSCELEPTDIESLSELGVGEDGEQRMLPCLEHLVLENVSDLWTGDIKRIITNRPALRSLELRGWDGSHVSDEDVHFMREAVEYFVLKTFYKESGALEEAEVDEESEEGSSTGTPSVGSWLSGDDEVVSANLVVANSGPA